MPLIPSLVPERWVLVTDSQIVIRQARPGASQVGVQRLARMSEAHGTQAFGPTCPVWKAF